MKAGDVVAGRFELEKYVASGGMGTVFRARDVVTGETAAVKLWHGKDTGLDRFEREANVIAALRHPGIVRYIAHGQVESGQPYLAMEWLEGEDLSVRLGRGSLGVAEGVLLGSRVAEALSSAHARGIVHRDIKPSNLFLPGGRIDSIKILDFGIARLADAQLTKSGVLVGTPGYMSPEQARGSKEIDARTDVFALGAVIYECLTGQAAFVGEHLMAIMAKIILDDPPRVSATVPSVPPVVDDLVARMLSKYADGRPRDGAAALAELVALGDLGPVEGAPQRPKALTLAEQQLLSVIVAGEGPAVSPRIESSLGRAMIRERLGKALGPFGLSAEWLASETAVVTLVGQGSATDQAARAARCALAIRQVWPDVPVALVTGRGIVTDRSPVGEVIDRAAKILAKGGEPGGGRAGGPRPILVDEVTAGLLGERFNMTQGAASSLLHSEREAEGAAEAHIRTLMGKATPFVGRDRELATLTGLYEECTSESSARAVVVTAGAGAGKSRLRAELLRGIELRGDGAEIWIGRGDPMRVGSPFGILAPALRRAVGIHEGEPAAEKQRRVADRVAKAVPEADRSRVTEFLGELLGVPFPGDDSPALRAARQDPRLMADQVRRAWEDWLEAECKRQPVVLVLEDLHWGDLPTVTFLNNALHLLRDRPFLVVAFARPEVDDLFPKLWAEHSGQRLHLGPLPKRACEKLIRHVLGDAGADVIEKIVARAAGNAFFLEELVRAMAEGKGDALPETVLAMVQMRLEALPPDARRALRAGSVFGQTFWAGAVREMAGAKGASLPLSEALGELASREMIRRQPESKFANDEEYVFRHAIVREAAYGMFTDEDRILGHRLAGGWLEQVGERDAFVLAEHFERGGELPKAAGWYRHAAEQALEANDVPGALERAQRGIQCGAQGTLLGELLLVQAEASNWKGDYEEGWRQARSALSLFPRGEPAWFRACLAAVNARSPLADYEYLVGVAKEIETMQVPPTAATRYVLAVTGLIQQLLFAGQYELADALVVQLDSGSKGFLDSNVTATIARTRGYRASFAGDLGEAAKFMESAAGEYRRAGNLRGASHQLADLGFLLLEMGAHDSAEGALRESLQGAERMSLATVAAAAKQNLSLVLARKGFLQAAIAAGSESARAFYEQKDRRSEGWSRVYLATAHCFASDLGRAEVEALASVELSAVTPPSRAAALATLAQVHLAQQRRDDAMARAQEAMDLLTSLGEIEGGESLVRLVYAEALEAVDRHGEAKTTIDKARDRLMERAGKIKDEDLRRSFLENVPENARTIELSRVWLTSN